MNIGGLLIGSIGPRELDEVLTRARTATPTYDHLGSTLRADAMAHQEHRDVGVGPAAFERAREGLRFWVTHRGIPATIHPTDQRVALGATVIVALRAGPFAVLAPNRVVAVTDDARRFAYAYGTLPGHPECGEESFTVELLDSGTVRATIRVQARPATLAARALAPLVRLLQRVALRRYLAALTAHVKGTKDEAPTAAS